MAFVLLVLLDRLVHIKSDQNNAFAYCIEINLVNGLDLVMFVLGGTRGHQGEWRRAMAVCGSIAFVRPS